MLAKSGFGLVRLCQAGCCTRHICTPTHSHPCFTLNFQITLYCLVGSFAHTGRGAEETNRDRDRTSSGHHRLRNHVDYAAMRSLISVSSSVLALTVVSFSAAATVPPTGVAIDTTTSVTCSRPSRAGDSIAVHYKGTLLSTGVEFDESYRRGSPFTFVLGKGRVIQGWDVGLLDMCPGEERTLTILPAFAYGNSGAGVIPPGSTLVFETKLVEIIGVKQDPVEDVMATPSSVTAAETEAAFSIATAPAEPEKEAEGEAMKEEVKTDSDKDDNDRVDPQHNDEDAGSKPPRKQAECHLLGPFALIVQAALGAMALLTLIWKRYRETPKRPWKIFFFDVSKQVLGSMLTHILNLAMSMLSSVAIVNQASQAAAQNSELIKDKDGRMPNPCSFYLLNLGIDVGRPLR